MQQIQLNRCSAGVGSEEQIAEGATQRVGYAASGEMMRPVVNEMAALTQASQVFQPIVAWIVIEVGSGQNDAGLTHVRRFLDVGLASRTAAMIAPGLTGVVVPPSIRQTANDFAMRTPAALTDAAGTLEPHMVAELRPVDRIKP